MKLKSFGCSFIFGSDLPIDQMPRSIYELLPNPYTYPSLIAKDLGMTYSCHARPGAGNLEILHEILCEIGKQEPSLFVINWSWIDRFSYIDEKKSKTSPGPLDRNPLGWSTILPVDDGELAKMYYKNLHSQLKDKIETLVAIKAAISCLREQKQQFIMTCIDDLIWEDQWHCPDSVKWLQQEIRPWVTAFEGTNFLDWSRDRGFDISPGWHPLKDAHRAAADLILSRWDDYIRA